MVPLPLTKVQVPVPVTAGFPASVAVVPQTVWLGPALETVGGAPAVIVTWSEVEGHGALLMVQSKTLTPAPNAVIPDVSEDGVVIVPDPLTTVHIPVPIVAAVPTRVAVVPHIVWSGPATATVGTATEVMVT